MKDWISRTRTPQNFEWQSFAQPDPLMQPAYTWIWNAPLRREEIACQIDQMICAGIRCIYVLPEPHLFREYNRRIGMEPDYLSEDFFHLMEYAAEYALHRGMRLWLYDEGGWPSGNACGRILADHPQICQKTLACRSILLPAGEAYVPGSQSLAAFAPGNIPISEGERFPGDMKLTEYYAAWHENGPVDPLDPDLGRLFVESTHRQYTRHIPHLLGGADQEARMEMMFTDEPGAGPSPWPRGFRQAFSRRFGYDILPHLPALMDASDCSCPADIRARMDYRQLAGEMFRDHYFVPIREWCHENHMLFTGHLDIDHLTDGCMYHNYGSPLELLRQMDVPGVDVIWRQIRIPGDDSPSCSEGNGFFPRFASSAAAQRGGKYAMSESFAVYGADVSGNLMRYVIHFQLVRGINIFNFMSMSYGSKSATHLVQRPDFRMEMPGYAHLRAINDYTARLCYLMQLGTPGQDTALYFPARDIWADGVIRTRAVAAFDALGRLLESQQVDFDIIDDEAARQAVYQDGALRVGAACYRHILIPDCQYMPEDVRRVLESMDHSISPAIGCDDPHIRVRSRRLPDGGMLWMLFNESSRPRHTRVSLPGSGPVYLIDGEFARAESIGDVSDLALNAGEARFFLRSPAPIPSAQTPFSRRTPAGQAASFSIRKVREAYIDESGLHERFHTDPPRAGELGGWARLMGDDFSGEAIYSGEMALDAPPQPGETYELDLGKVECSASVAINGIPVGIAWASPYRVRFDGQILSGQDHFLLEIRVANTLASHLVAHPPKDLYPPADLGPYQEKLNAFEKNAPEGGLYGPVCLYRLTT